MSQAIRLLHGIQSLEFNAGIRGAELPVDRAHSLVAMILPLLNLLTGFFDSGNVVRQTLPHQHAQFNFGNIQPTGVFGGIMDLQAICQGFGLCRREYF